MDKKANEVQSSKKPAPPSPTRQEALSRRRMQRTKRRQRRKRKRLLLFSVFLAILILCGILLMRGSLGKDRDLLCGRWDLDGTTVYVFDGNGKGTMELPESKYDFQYSIRDSTVNIDFVDEHAQDSSYDFTIQKNQLTLTGKEKQETITYIFKRQKE